MATLRTGKPVSELRPPAARRAADASRSGRAEPMRGRVFETARTPEGFGSVGVDTETARSSGPGARTSPPRSIAPWRPPSSSRAAPAGACAPLRSRSVARRRLRRPPGSGRPRRRAADRRWPPARGRLGEAARRRRRGRAHGSLREALPVRLARARERRRWAIVAPPGRLLSVMAFTVTNARIVQIDALVDPKRLAAVTFSSRRVSRSSRGAR